MHTIVVQQSPSIHWEAVIITAIPAFFAMVASIVAVLIGKKNHETIKSIDKAVNGTMPGESTLREDVKNLVERRDLDPKVNP